MSYLKMDATYASVISEWHFDKDADSKIRDLERSLEENKILEEKLRRENEELKRENEELKRENEELKRGMKKKVENANVLLTSREQVFRFDGECDENWTF
jgi:predicted RNase H-like nuclease (RuvC/YqgF family)